MTLRESFSRSLTKGAIWFLFGVAYVGGSELGFIVARGMR